MRVSVAVGDELPLGTEAVPCEAYSKEEVNVTQLDVLGIWGMEVKTLVRKETDK